MSIDSQRRIDPRTIAVVKVEKTKFGIKIPWRTMRLPINVGANIYSLTDRPDDYGLVTHNRSAELRTTITPVARDRIAVIEDIRPLDVGTEFVPVTRRPKHILSEECVVPPKGEEITLSPNKPIKLKAGWSERVIVTML